MRRVVIGRKAEKKKPKNLDESRLEERFNADHYFKIDREDIDFRYKGASLKLDLYLEI